MPDDDPRVTDLLRSLDDDEKAAMERLWPLVYPELHRIAHRELRRIPGNETLQTTAVVHEAYLKLKKSAVRSFRDRSHFYAVSALAMRQILVDYARRRLAEKRGGGRRRETLDETMRIAESRALEILSVHEALHRLAETDERSARTVELRFFAGLSEEEAGRVLGVSQRTVRRDWRRARAFLNRALQSPD